MSTTEQPKAERTRKPKARHWATVLTALQENSATLALALESTDHAGLLRALIARSTELNEELQRALGSLNGKPEGAEWLQRALGSLNGKPEGAE